MNSSPFSDTRFEYEIKHLYYLQEDLYAILQKTKPCFLIGSRGTGKTTLLRSLSWRERLSNDGLKMQFGERLFRDFIGIYVKLPDVQLDAISIWLERAADNLRRAIYSRYLELIQLQEIFEAVAELESAGEFSFSASVEQECVKSLVEKFNSELYLEGVGVRSPASFLDLSKSTRMLRRFIEKASQQNTAPSLVLEKIGSPTQLGELSREVARSLSEVLSSSSKAGRIYFKVCFDEAETLDPFGVRVLSTWVRLSSGPLHHVISFVSKPESLSDTLLPNLTVQSADVVYLDLDDIKDKEFQAFAEGVTTLRLREVARLDNGKKHPAIVKPFNTERLFGKLNLNFLLEDALRESVSPFAKELLKRAALRSGGELSTDDRLRRGDDSALPIYEAYLEMRTKRTLPGADAPRWSKRRATSQLTRKAMIAAYLSIMNELHTKPKYAYADMILQISDSCIRDFLNNLEYIYQESKLPLTQFLMSPRIKSTTQSSGLLAASKAKVRSLPMYGVNHPSSTAKLVNGLGRVTELLQTRSKDGVRHLKTTERGIFHLVTSAGSEDARRAMDLIIDAAEAGFLKILESDELMINFRVHTSLAPAFGFSYRGAYYPVTVQSADVLAFADASDDQKIERCAMSLYERLDDVRGADLFSGITT